MQKDVFHVLLPGSLCKGGKDSMMMSSILWDRRYTKDDATALFPIILKIVHAEIVKFLEDAANVTNTFHSVFVDMG